MACLDTNGKDPVNKENDETDKRGSNFQWEFLALMREMVSYSRFSRETEPIGVCVCVCGNWFT